MHGMYCHRLQQQAVKRLCVMPSPSVSRMQVQFIDKSSNGSFHSVQGTSDFQRLKKGSPVELAIGDVIQLGGISKDANAALPRYQVAAIPDDIKGKLPTSLAALCQSAPATGSTAGPGCATNGAAVEASKLVQPCANCKRHASEALQLKETLRKAKNTAEEVQNTLDQRTSELKDAKNVRKSCDLRIALTGKSCIDVTWGAVLFSFVSASDKVAQCCT